MKIKEENTAFNHPTKYCNAYNARNFSLHSLWKLTFVFILARENIGATVSQVLRPFAFPLIG